MGIFPVAPHQGCMGLWNNFRFHTPVPLLVSESQGLEFESFPDTCHRDRQQFLDVGGSTASGRGMWQLPLWDIVFLAPVGGNVSHVLPSVYRARLGMQPVAEEAGLAGPNHWGLARMARPKRK